MRFAGFTRASGDGLEAGGEALVGAVEVEAGGVEFFTEPFEGLLVPVLGVVVKGLDVLVVAVDAPHVVEGGGVFAGEALRDVIGVAAGRAFFELDDVVPRIAEIVFIDDLVALGGEDSADEFFVGPAVIFVVEIGIGGQDVISLCVAQARR